MSPRAQVAINGLFLDHPRTGTGVYAREVLSRLLRSEATPDPTRRYTVLGHPEHAALWARQTPYIGLRAPLRRRSEKLEKVLWEQAILPAAVARLGADLLYAPYFSLPLAAPCRTVVTVHDLIPLLLPEYAPSPAFKAYFRLVSAAVRRADAVITDSHHAAADITRLLGIPSARLHVVYLGVDPLYTHAQPPEVLEALRLRLGLPSQFILYLGGIDPRKNVSLLLRALHFLRQHGRRTLPLAIVAPSHGRFADPREEAGRLGLHREVHFLDWIDEVDKPALYQAATAFVYPSRYEGFGLPPLEALASGLPVLCAQASSLPEVVGEAALLADPDDVEGWAAALERLGTDEALRADLARRGRERAALFTWEHTVDDLVQVFTSILA